MVSCLPSLSFIVFCLSSAPRYGFVGCLLAIWVHLLFLQPVDLKSRIMPGSINMWTVQWVWFVVTWCTDAGCFLVRVFLPFMLSYCGACRLLLLIVFFAQSCADAFGRRH